MAARQSRLHWDLENNLETGEPDPIEEYPSEKRVVSGSVWMLVNTMALFFLPVANGLIAGAIGGFRVGNMRNALIAASGALLLSSCLLWITYSLFPIPVMGSPLTQIGAVVLILLTDFATLVGAAIGGHISHSRIDRWNRA